METSHVYRKIPQIVIKSRQQPTRDTKLRVSVMLAGKLHLVRVVRALEGSFQIDWNSAMLRSCILYKGGCFWHPYLQLSNSPISFHLNKKTLMICHPLSGSGLSQWPSFWTFTRSHHLSFPRVGSGHNLGSVRTMCGSKIQSPASVMCFRQNNKKNNSVCCGGLNLCVKL